MSSLVRNYRCSSGFTVFLFVALLVFSEGRLKRYSKKKNEAALPVTVYSNKDIRSLQTTDFLDSCMATFDEAASDGVISEAEFVNFLNLTMCSTTQISQPDFCGVADLTMNDLPLEFQFTFVLFVCGNASNQTECTESLSNDENFGLNVGDVENLSEETEILCSAVAKYGGFDTTDAPTESTPTTPPAPTTSPVVTSEVPSAPPTNAPTPSDVISGIGKETTTDDTLGAGPIAGISIAAAFVVLLGVFLISRKRRGNQSRQNKDQELQNDELREIESDNNIITGDQSIMTENSKDIYLEQSGSGLKSGDTNRSMEVVSMDVLDDNNASANEPIAADPQFSRAAAAGAAVAGVTGAAVAAGAINDSNNDAEPRGKKLDNLDNAIDAGDWEAAYQIASALSSDNEASSKSSRGSRTSSNRSSARSLTAEDQALAEKLDELIDKGDFDAVAHLTKQYSEKSKVDDAGAEQKRSIFDMLSGKKTETATTSGAAAAVLRAASESEEEESQKEAKKGNWAGLFNRSGKYEYMVDNMGSETESETGGEVAFLTAAGGHYVNQGSVASGSVSGSASGKESSPISSSRSTPIDPDMVQDFEKLIEANDWEGLAALAGEGAVPKDSTSERNTDQGVEAGGPVNPEDVELRRVSNEPRSPPAANKPPEKKQKSLHGAKVLIPYWEEEIGDKTKKASLGKMDDDEKDLDNDLLLGKNN